jgi:hypothetical protein
MARGPARPELLPLPVPLAHKCGNLAASGTGGQNGHRVHAALACLPGAQAVYGDGNSANAPGQSIAKQNCHEAFDNQSTLQAGGGPKSGDVGPLNCDHFWQDQGAIGGGP